MKEGRFLSSWKTANIAPNHKKNEKKLIIKYRPVSLLPMCSKVSESPIYNSIYKFLSNNNLLSQNQSGFWSGDFFINQLISITHHCVKVSKYGPEITPYLDTFHALDIFHSFDSYESLEVQSPFWYVKSF